MKVLFEPGSGWGNYAIRGITEIELPEAISLWPQTPGWWFLLACLLVWVVIRVFNLIRRYWRNRYRRVASAQLQQLQQQFMAGDKAVLQQLPVLLKATALQAYPRSDVASLHGKDWEQFLDSRYAGQGFTQQFSGVLSALSYGSPQSLESSMVQPFCSQLQRWIETHQHEVSDD